MVSDDEKLLMYSSHGIPRSKITYKGLINALDGVGMQQSGLIFILTTNHRHHLPASLKRAGRIDSEYRFAAVDEIVARRIFASFFPTSTDRQQQEFASMAKQAGALSSVSTLQFVILSQRKFLDSPDAVLKSLPGALQAAKSHGALDIEDLKDSWFSSFGNIIRYGGWAVPVLPVLVTLVLNVLPLLRAMKF
eukprot:gnl/TRDRNA2_/TRDRNA2_110682_c3_seq2.p1 gnl/TRDRNA2_/TRDRNA2_110682_c3~~gnl/TRDRNA2_/TRDRNA2_110682_c3_seq2.p1  ORF type:complete len:225 (+),score=41.03 gnl/TRDRNA2_/TRDRNA2_110682_c3_seq2:102-677(+)